MILNIRMAFFDGDTLLSGGEVLCQNDESITVFNGEEGHSFEIKSSFEEPACPIFITYKYNVEQVYRSAMRFGVHSSNDWETLNLGNIHTLVYKSQIVAISNI